MENGFETMEQGQETKEDALMAVLAMRNELTELGVSDSCIVDINTVVDSLEKDALFPDDAIAEAFSILEKARKGK